MAAFSEELGGAVEEAAAVVEPQSPPRRQVSLARLAEFGITPRRSLGQNFLIDDNILGLILERLAASPSDVIIEVGAGLGVLTRALAGVGSCVHAFEIDGRLEPALRATLGPLLDTPPRVLLHLQDIMRASLETLTPAPTLCASNLPYSVATPFLAESMTRLPRVRRYCVMVQREVADRLVATPGSKAYGAVSVWVQLHTRLIDVRPLSRAIFYPRPHVDSSMVTLESSSGGPPDERRRHPVAGVVRPGAGAAGDRQCFRAEAEDRGERTSGGERSPQGDAGRRPRGSGCIGGGPRGAAGARAVGGTGRAAGSGLATVTIESRQGRSLTRVGVAQSDRGSCSG